MNAFGTKPCGARVGQSMCARGLRSMQAPLLNLLRALLFEVNTFMIVSPTYKHVGVLVSPANPTEFAVGKIVRGPCA